MKNILIIGARYAGKAVVAEIVEDKNKIQYKIVGFLENNDFKVGKIFRNRSKG